MSALPPMFVLRVFTDASGRHGNALGVFLDTGDLPDSLCQQTAYRLGFSETVFVDDPATGTCRIFTPAVPLRFAGHPMVGTAWLLARHGGSPKTLRPPAGPIRYGQDGSDWWVEAQAEWCPPWRLRELPNQGEVDRATAPGGDARDMVWAWTEREVGAVRARVFAAAFGVTEDEATGSAAIRLAVTLDRPLTLPPGKGARLVVAPTDDGSARVGGRVHLDRQQQPRPSSRSAAMTGALSRRVVGDGIA